MTDLFADDTETAAQLDAAKLDALAARWHAEYGTHGPTCGTCGAPIRWALTWATGTWIPIDREPAAGGNITVRRAGAAVIADVHGAGGTPEGARWRSHFADCPQADEHRRPR
jgi:hypothetical protein